jgi:hypothetical protein
MKDETINGNTRSSAGGQTTRTDLVRTHSPVDVAVQQVSQLPLAGIVALMLAAAMAFFCFAMPQRVLDTVLGTIGVAAPVGTVGRTVFLLLAAGLAGLLGWLAVTVAGRSGAAPGLEGAAEVRSRPSARKASAPAYPPGTIEGAPPPLPVRRSDSHPDAPPRRPIFAELDLPAVEAAAPPEPAAPAPDVSPSPVAASEGPEVRAAEPAALELAPFTAADPVAAEPAADAETAEARAEPESVAEETALAGDREEAVADMPVADEPVEDQPAAIEPVRDEPVSPEPAAVTEPVPSPVSADPLPPAQPAVAVAPEERTIAMLMARFERGLDHHGSALPPPPTPEQIAALDDAPADDNALRTAIETLQHIAPRQR